MRNGIALLLALLFTAAQAEEAACHVTYGGETSTLKVAQGQSPYTVPATAVGSYFLFRALVDADTALPAGLHAVKIYVYADKEAGATLIHQADFPWPVNEGTEQRHGFSGLQRVYEPVRDGELRYWCSVVDLWERK